MRRAPRFVAPAFSASPSRTGTGAASPVRTALSSDDRPEMTTPSTGTISPDRTSTRSPGTRAASGTSTTGASGPSPSSRRANSRKAAPRKLSARSRAARWAPRWSCRAPSRAATSIASESNHSGPAAADGVPRAGRERRRECDGDRQVDVDNPRPEAGDRRDEERTRRVHENRDGDGQGQPAKEGFEGGGHPGGLAGVKRPMEEHQVHRTGGRHAKAGQAGSVLGPPRLLGA